ATGCQAQALLEALAERDRRLDLRDGGHLRQGEDQSVRQGAGGGEGGDEAVERADAAAPGRRLEALEPDADERRRGACGDGLGHALGGEDGVCVLPVVVAGAVAVLEVE